MTYQALLIYADHHLRMITWFCSKQKYKQAECKFFLTLLICEMMGYNCEHRQRHLPSTTTMLCDACVCNWVGPNSMYQSTVGSQKWVWPSTRRASPFQPEFCMKSQLAQTHHLDLLRYCLDFHLPEGSPSKAASTVVTSFFFRPLQYPTITGAHFSLHSAVNVRKTLGRLSMSSISCSIWSIVKNVCTVTQLVSGGQLIETMYL